MLTLKDGHFWPERLCLLKSDKLLVMNMQQDGIVIGYGEEKSRILKMGESFEFNCQLGRQIVLCNRNAGTGEIVVFCGQKEREQFEEICTDLSRSDSEDNLVTMAQLKQSTGDSQSTSYFKENQSTTSERCEQVFPDWRGRKGSDPVIKSHQTSVQKKGDQIIQQRKQIEIYINKQYKQRIKIEITQEQNKYLLQNHKICQQINEYLMNQYNFIQY